MSDKTSEELKQTLADMDQEIVHLFNARAACAKQLHDDFEIDDAESTLGNVKWAMELAKTSQGPLFEDCVQAALRELGSGIRRLIEPVRVAYLGPEYSYSYLATIERFGQSAELVPVGTIAAVFEEVHARQSQFGMVPIENSTDGRIVDTLDMFSRVPVKICGEVQLAIHHNLLGRCKQQEITNVYSKPQALSQCRSWLSRHLPQAKLIETASTTAAAQLAATEQGAAAVASLQAGKNYGLDVISPNIEDNKHNVTRFAVIGEHAGERTGCDKTSLLFEIPHQPGALADIMTIFKSCKLNMTWIESFPIAGTPNEYLFFVEIEGHQDDKELKQALKELGATTVRLEVLGCYEVSQVVG